MKTLFIRSKVYSKVNHWNVISNLHNDCYYLSPFSSMIAFFSFDRIDLVSFALRKMWDTSFAPEYKRKLNWI